MIDTTTGRSPFGEAWRSYVSGTNFDALPPHDKALVRVAFIAGWHARGHAEGKTRFTMQWNSEAFP